MSKHIKNQNLISGIYVIALVLAVGSLRLWIEPIAIPLSYGIIISFSIIILAVILYGFRIYKGKMHIKPMTYVFMIAIILLLAIQVGVRFDRYLTIKPDYEALVPDIELCLEDQDQCNIASIIDGLLLKSALDSHSNSIFLYVQISIIVIIAFPLLQYDPTIQKEIKAYDV